MPFKQALKRFGPKARGWLEDQADEARDLASRLFDEQDTGYFDLTGTLDTPTHSADIPLERYQGVRTPKGIDRLDPQTSRRLLDTSLQGMRQGAHGWYNTQPLHDEFVRVLGPVQGDAQYRRYMDYVAATSPRSTVRQNIKRASVPYMRESQGLPVEGMLNPTQADLGPNVFPEGYGHLANKVQAQLIDEIATGGMLDPATRPKVASFSQNLQGNYAPMTLDTHNRAAIFPQDVKPNKAGEMVKKSPSKQEYGILEQYQAELGRMLGLEPAQWQSSLWTGGAADTGVRDAKNFMHIFNESLKDTAARDGITEREAVEAFIKGEIPLASIMGAGAVGVSEAELDEMLGGIGGGGALV